MKKQGYTSTKKMNAMSVPAYAKPAGALKKKGKKKK